ncbi:hypothetical protein Cgig2_005511 [Carnegiea gigantea]|uniref:DUF4283 domain-containing protein n=1 Tax=Carnegiea gigantea TaxID=171969 RepID=A0A9Q1JSE7_9CARY|nr:hypothetical protein Cgig2_005511 [Carnegiea gigantea]
MDELIVLCLLAKIWGELLPLALIIAKIKMDWKHIRGQVDYIELGNGWVLLRCASILDKNYVWFNRPWFVEGLNLVLTPWIPYFDPCSIAIGHIDQWAFTSGEPESKENWIRVSPKKRERLSSISPADRSHYGDKGKAVLIETPPIRDDKSFDDPVLVSVPIGCIEPVSVPLLPHELFPPITASTYLSGTSFVVTHVLSPTSLLDTTISSSPEGDSGSANSGNATDFEDVSDMYLEPEDLNEPLHSTESTKKQKIEDGDECSSHPTN